jgi:hypothetical protein
LNEGGSLEGERERGGGGREIDWDKSAGRDPHCFSSTAFYKGMKSLSLPEFPSVSGSEPVTVSLSLKSTISTSAI